MRPKACPYFRVSVLMMFFVLFSAAIPAFSQGEKPRAPKSQGKEEKDSDWDPSQGSSLQEEEEVKYTEGHKTAEGLKEGGGDLARGAALDFVSCLGTEFSLTLNACNQQGDVTNVQDCVRKAMEEPKYKKCLADATKNVPEAALMAAVAAFPGGVVIFNGWIVFKAVYEVGKAGVEAYEYVDALDEEERSLKLAVETSLRNSGGWGSFDARYKKLAAKFKQFEADGTALAADCENDWTNQGAVSQAEADALKSRVDKLARDRAELLGQWIEGFRAAYPGQAVDGLMHELEIDASRVPDVTVKYPQCGKLVAVSKAACDMRCLEDDADVLFQRMMEAKSEHDYKMSAAGLGRLNGAWAAWQKSGEGQAAEEAQAQGAWLYNNFMNMKAALDQGIDPDGRNSASLRDLQARMDANAAKLPRNYDAATAKLRALAYLISGSVDKTDAGRAADLFASDPGKVNRFTDIVLALRTIQQAPKGLFDWAGYEAQADDLLCSRNWQSEGVIQTYNQILKDHAGSAGAAGPDERFQIVEHAAKQLEDAQKEIEPAAKENEDRAAKLKDLEGKVVAAQEKILYLTDVASKQDFKFTSIDLDQAASRIADLLGTNVGKNGLSDWRPGKIWEHQTTCAAYAEGYRKYFISGLQERIAAVRSLAAASGAAVKSSGGGGGGSSGGGGSGGGNQVPARVRQFYDRFCRAYSGSDLVTIKHMVSAGWSSNNGDNLGDLEGNLSRAFSIYRNVKCSISNISVGASYVPNGAASGLDSALPVSYHISISGELAAQRGIVKRQELDLKETLGQKKNGEFVILNSDGGWGL